jgi:hypothetical protein
MVPIEPWKGYGGLPAVGAPDTVAGDLKSLAVDLEMPSLYARLTTQWPTAWRFCASKTTICGLLR